MSYLLDTNAVIAVLGNKPAQVQVRLVQAVRAGGRIATSSIVLFELWYGVSRSRRRRENTEQLKTFLSGDVDLIGFDGADAQIAGELRAELSASGTPIGPYDVLIAAQALRTNATLVTANTREFSRVRGLSWQDWANAN